MTTTTAGLGLDELVEFIREHQFRAEVRDGVVWGEMLWSTRTSSGATWERVGTTLRETCAWLGY